MSAGAATRMLSRRQMSAMALSVLPLASLGHAAELTAVRLAISESILGEVNLTDARLAMRLWIKLMGKDLNVVITPKLFSNSQEIHDRARRGELDAIALNVIEYRHIADLLDTTQIISAGGSAGHEQYLLLVKQESGIRRIEDLKGRRLYLLKSPRMCLAMDWLSNTLEAAHLGPKDRFFPAILEDAKFSKVVLPVFFGQADACLTTKQGFDTMCELNPQVGRALKAVASSPAMTLNIYIFRKGYHLPDRAKVIQAIAGLRGTVSGRQLATLFQFDELIVQDGNCLAAALGILRRADQHRGRQGRG